MNDFEPFQSDCGDLSVRHRLTSILVHSAANPTKEAADAATSLLRNTSAQFTLIGVGLGYLAAELARQGRLHKCYEPFAELQRYAGQCGILNGAVHEVQNGDALAADFRQIDCTQCGEIVVAPYVRALSDHLATDVREAVNRLQVANQSRKFYAPLIERNMRLNVSRWSALRQLQSEFSRSDKPAIAIGAGPSLDRCMDVIHGNREKFLLIAASGAMPALSAAMIQPDWTVALEARETLAGDLVFAAPSQKTVVFPWTHPAAFNNRELQLYGADENAIVTSGGTSAITAADLALKLTSGPLFLIGIELTNSHGSYANSANRLSADTRTPAPKFEIMRTALQEWAQANCGREITHVLPDGVVPVHGIRHASIRDFVKLVSAMKREYNLDSIL